MIRLESITLREIRLPLKEPFRISSGMVSERRIGLLELRDDSGATAWSECVAGETPNYSPETIDTAWIAITEWLAPRVIGRPVVSPGDIFPLLEQDIRGHLMAKAAVEMGFWGLEATRLDMSLSQLLGGTRREIDVGISLGIQKSPEALSARVVAAIADGYRKVKIKIMPDPTYSSCRQPGMPLARRRRSWRMRTTPIRSMTPTTSRCWTTST